MHHAVQIYAVVHMLIILHFAILLFVSPCSPDKNPDSKEAAEAKFKEISKQQTLQ